MKFEKMAFAKKPTGSADIPLHICRVKDIKKKIAQKEVMGYVYENEDISAITNGITLPERDNMLKAARLFQDKVGSVRTPVTIRQKSKDISEAIVQIGEDTLKGANDLTETINNLAEALKTTSSTST